MRRRLVRADALTEFVRAVNASLEPERVADTIIASVDSWIPVAGWLVLVTDETAPARLLWSPGLRAGLEASAQMVGEFVLAGGGGDLFATADAASDGRLVKQAGATAAAALGFPLVSRGRRVGALVGIDHGPASREPRMGKASLDALRAVLEPGAVALDNAIRIQRAEALSVTDDLTQLYNSRYLSQVLRRETKRASRSGRPLSLLFIDLDGFKGVNDAHGHLTGSSALVEAAAVIRISARETDIVARFGGDEFALVLPETGTDGAEMVAARIRDKIAAHPFLKKDGLDIRLSVSVGVATLPDVAASAEQLVKAADEAMYWVKDHGKNNVHVAGRDEENAKDAKEARTAKGGGRDWTFR